VHSDWDEGRGHGQGRGGDKLSALGQGAGRGASRRVERSRDGDSEMGGKGEGKGTKSRPQMLRQDYHEGMAASTGQDWTDVGGGQSQDSPAGKSNSLGIPATKRWSKTAGYITSDGPSRQYLNWHPIYQHIDPDASKEAIAAIASAKSVAALEEAVSVSMNMKKLTAEALAALVYRAGVLAAKHKHVTPSTGRDTATKLALSALRLLTPQVVLLPS
jgi:hypothetical protein